MCRLFGLLGNPKTPADPWLLETDRSLLKQSHVSEERAQRDGWGIAWYTEKRTPQVEKGPRGAFEETREFTHAAHAARGPVVLGHLRHASNPLGLPRERLLGLENSQPFVHRNYLFGHNGSIPYPRETRALLGRYESSVMGVNDSEVLFWLLVKNTETVGDPLEGYRRTVGDLVTVWESAGRGVAEPFSALNVIFTRGPNELWAFCLWRGEHGPRLLDATRPYFDMTYLADAKQCVVGSEPFDARRSDWRDLSNGEYLVARADRGLVAVETGAINAPKVAPLAARR